MTVVTLAHLTDVHLGPIRGLTPGYWNLKRAMGFANWQRNRVGLHRRDVAQRLLVDLKAQLPDHIAVTGDLTNLGLPQEHSDALDWLRSVGSPDDVSVIPGNHDIYSSLHGDPGVDRWRHYMSSDRAGAALAGEPTDVFPYLRRVGSIALVGLNSAIPTPPLIAAGALGQAQMERTEQLLARLSAERVFTVVMIHHPPLPGQASQSRGLRDAAAFERILLKYGAGLALHGHNHRNMLAWRAGPFGAFPVIGAPSFSAAQHHKNEPLARYNLYRIETGHRDQSIELIGRGLAEPGGPVVELERRVLVAPAMHEMARA